LQAHLKAKQQAGPGSIQASWAGGTSEPEKTSKMIAVEGLTLAAGTKSLLTNTPLRIHAVQGKRYGLVGPNGKGKSTLLTAIAARLIPVPEHVDIAHVHQEAPANEQSALECVMSADERIKALKAEEKDIEARLESMEFGGKNSQSDGGEGEDEEDKSQSLQDLTERLQIIHETLSGLDSDTAIGRASKILYGLGFTSEMQSAQTKSFSGGWRMRIALARALYLRPDFLLLDEPTNHLDLKAVFWLQSYLKKWKQGLILVSHDREFLNTVSTHIVHLHREQLVEYVGDFEKFESLLNLDKQKQNKAYEKFQKGLKTVRNDQKKREKFLANYKKTSGSNELPQKWTDYEVKFEFRSRPPLPPPVLQLNDVYFKYPNRTDFGLRKVNIHVDCESRVAIVGPNGAGKSTVMKLLTQELRATKGGMERDQKAVIGKYSQHFVDILDMDDSPIDYLLRKYPQEDMGVPQLRALLGRFGLPGFAHVAPIFTLSGGQKARVVFASMSIMAPHVMLMDEPTNNLDMQSIDALGDALEEYKGGVVVISHDARLLERVTKTSHTTQIWEVEDGRLTHFPEGFAEYKQALLDKIKDDDSDDY